MKNKKSFTVIIAPARNVNNCSRWSVKTRGKGIRNIPTGSGSLFAPFWAGRFHGTFFDVMGSAIDPENKEWIADLKEISGDRYLKIFNALAKVKISRHESRARVIEIYI